MICGRAALAKVDFRLLGAVRSRARRLAGRGSHSARSSVTSAGSLSVPRGGPGVRQRCCHDGAYMATFRHAIPIHSDLQTHRADHGAGSPSAVRSYASECERFAQDDTGVSRALAGVLRRVSRRSATEPQHHPQGRRHEFPMGSHQEQPDRRVETTRSRRGHRTTPPRHLTRLEDARLAVIVNRTAVGPGRATLRDLSEAVIAYAPTSVSTIRLDLQVH